MRQFAAEEALQLHSISLTDYTAIPTAWCCKGVQQDNRAGESGKACGNRFRKAGAYPLCNPERST